MFAYMPKHCVLAVFVQVLITLRRGSVARISFEISPTSSGYVGGFSLSLQYFDEAWPAAYIDFLVLVRMSKPRHAEAQWVGARRHMSGLGAVCPNPEFVFLGQCLYAAGVGEESAIAMCDSVKNRIRIRIIAPEIPSKLQRVVMHANSHNELVPLFIV